VLEEEACVWDTTLPLLLLLLVLLQVTRVAQELAGCLCV
jgi:hypothetical protein